MFKTQTNIPYKNHAQEKKKITQYMETCRKGINKVELQSLLPEERIHLYPIINKVNKRPGVPLYQEKTNAKDEKQMIGHYRDIVVYQNEIRSDNIEAITREIDNQFKCITFINLSINTIIIITHLIFSQVYSN